MKKEYLNEIWKPIKGYEGLYEVSNWGRVKSLKFGKGKILKLFKDTSGYLCVKLCKNTNQCQFKVHRLVAQAFIPNPNNLPQINHKDECKTNNIVSNLEWCDRKYNINYGTRTEKCSKKVYQYTLDGKFVKEWKSTRECGRNGYNNGNVAACCRGKLKKYKNFIWKYK